MFLKRIQDWNELSPYRVHEGGEKYWEDMVERIELDLPSGLTTSKLLMLRLFN